MTDLTQWGTLPVEEVTAREQIVHPPEYTGPEYKPPKPGTGTDPEMVIYIYSQRHRPAKDVSRETGVSPSTVAKIFRRATRKKLLYKTFGPASAERNR